MEKNEHLWTTEKDTCKNERNKKEEGGVDARVDLRDTARGLVTCNMHRARQHHEECDAHGDYDEMQKDKRHSAMKPMVFMKQEANMSRHST